MAKGYLMGVLALTLTSGLAQAQVYKCARPGGGTEYSQSPCGANAEEIKVRAAPVASPDDGSDRNRQAIAQSNALSSAVIAERNCVARAEADILGPSGRRVAEYRQHIDALNAQLADAGSNLAGATSQAGIRAQISGLHQSMATERSSADAQAIAARQGCAEIRRAREDEIRGSGAATSGV